MMRRGPVRDAQARQPERLLIRGARLVDRPRELDRVADLYVADGRIVGIGAAPGAARFEAERIIDGTLKAGGSLTVDAENGEVILK